jgi:hypothetical protein
VTSAHDYAAITLYSLSCHKFLIYSSMAYVRWMNWSVLVLAVSFHGLPFLMVNYAMIHVTKAQLDLVLLEISIIIDVFRVVFATHHSCGLAETILC